MSRVAYVCADPGVPVFGTKGASVHVQEIIRAWRARGDDVTIYCTRTGDDRPADLADIPVVHLRVPRLEPGLSGADAHAARERAQVEASAALAAAVVADGADVVYERYSLFSTVLAEVCGALQVPGILEVNAPLIDEQREHRVLVDEAAALTAFDTQARAASRIACVSVPVADWVRTTVSTELPEPVVVVAPNGVNVDRITAVQQAPDDPLVVFVGTLKPWHGVDVLVLAAALAKQPWRLRIIGAGPQEQAVRQQAEALGVDVELTGALAPQDVPAALAGAWVGVAPYPATVAEQYFSPLKIYEYSAAALPVVASAVGQVPSIVDDGVTGLLVPPSDAHALAAAIDRLVADPSYAARLGQQGRTVMSEQHTWHRVLQRCLDGLDIRAASVAGAQR